MHKLGPSRFKIESKSDWCHVCGKRRFVTFAELWIPRNAEHDRSLGKHRSYIRMCQTCVQVMLDATHDPEGVSLLLERSCESQSTHDDSVEGRPFLDIPPARERRTTR